MLLSPRYADAIAAGTLTLVFRRWRRLQVRPGRRYRTGAGIIEVESVDIVAAVHITGADARRAGYSSVSSLCADLRGEPRLPVYRIALHGVPGPDPRTELASDDRLKPADIAAIRARLARLDRASSHGPWTAQTLDLIATRPGVRAGDLAASVGREMAPFKLDVRKLKGLGLTLSLAVGYRLSARGIAYRDPPKRSRPAPHSATVRGGPLPRRMP